MRILKCEVKKKKEKEINQKSALLANLTLKLLLCYFKMLRCLFLNVIVSPKSSPVYTSQQLKRKQAERQLDSSISLMTLIYFLTF